MMVSVTLVWLCEYLHHCCELLVMWLLLAASEISALPVEVPESAGSVTICVGFVSANVVAGFPIEVLLDFLTGSASSKWLLLRYQI